MRAQRSRQQELWSCACSIEEDAPEKLLQLCCRQAVVKPGRFSKGQYMIQKGERARGESRSQ